MATVQGDKGHRARERPQKREAQSQRTSTETRKLNFAWSQQTQGGGGDPPTPSCSLLLPPPSPFLPPPPPWPASQLPALAPSVTGQLQPVQPGFRRTGTATLPPPHASSGPRATRLPVTMGTRPACWKADGASCTWPQVTQQPQCPRTPTAGEGRKAGVCAPDADAEGQGIRISPDPSSQ